MNEQIQVKFTLTLPDQRATDEEIQEWLDYQLNATGGMSGKNPLVGFDIEANTFSVEFDDN